MKICGKISLRNSALSLTIVFLTFTHMKIHKEGYPTLILAIIVLSLLNTGFYFWFENIPFLRITGYLFSFVVYCLLLNFFRNPPRITSPNESHIISPADGKVVVIEETFEPEYFKDKRLQISVFMSPLNVHANRCPVAGKVKLMKYHPGKYLVAFHPKSSTENERTTMVIESSRSTVLMRQIAGFVARRIVWYTKEEQVVKQGEEMGFIKFGSRVDLFLPLNTKVKVSLNQIVRGGETVLAEV